MPPQGNPAGGPPPGPGAGVPQPGQQPGAGIDPEKIRLLKEPTWEEVESLLKNPVLREFRIDVETDSTIRTDEDADRSARMEFIEAVGKMITEAATVPHQMIPAAGELILFGIRGFKVARNLERVFEDAIDQLKNMPPPPPPEMLKAQAEAQTQKEVAQIKADTDLKIAQGQQAAQAQEDRLRTQFEAQRNIEVENVKGQHAKDLEDLKSRFEAEKAQFEAQSAEKIASAKNATDIEIARMKTEHEARMKAADQQHEANITAMTQDHERSLAVHQSQSAVDGERVKGEESRKTEDHKAEHAKAIEGVKGHESRETEKVKGETQKEVTKLKPKAEADAKVKEETDKQHPTVDAITKLTEALKEARKPRKVVRDKDGRIAELH